CSGLLQVALQAAGSACPRDSDMQEAELGDQIDVNDGLDCLERGDLVFWKGHVGIMTDGFMLLHANAHHMAAVIEPFRSAVDRIARGGWASSSVRRGAQQRHRPPSREDWAGAADCRRAQPPLALATSDAVFLWRRHRAPDAGRGADAAVWRAGLGPARGPGLA